MFQAVRPGLDEGPLRSGTDALKTPKEQGGDHRRRIDDKAGLSNALGHTSSSSGFSAMFSQVRPGIRNSIPELELGGPMILHIGP